MWGETQMLKQSPEFTFGFWHGPVNDMYAYHGEVGLWLNIIPGFFACYTAYGGLKHLGRHVSTWAWPKRGHLSRDEDMINNEQSR
jgi:hypothetical protein